MRGVLTATTAEFLEFQPLGRRLAVLRCRIVPLFAVTALHCHNFSGHCSLPTSLLWRGRPRPRLSLSWLHTVARTRASAPHSNLLNNLRDRSRSHRVPAFTNREAQALL